MANPNNGQREYAQDFARDRIARVVEAQGGGRALSQLGEMDAHTLEREVGAGKVAGMHRPSPRDRGMFDFGAYDSSARGDGKGFGQADLDYIREAGGSDENIRNFMRDYQASGGRVGKRASKWATMQDSEAGALAGSDHRKNLGDWWNKRKGGKTPDVGYDYESHDASAHGGRGIGLKDLEHMRSSGASDENMKKYIRDYRSQGGVVGKKAASFAGIAPHTPQGVQGPNRVKPGSWAD